LDRNYSVHKYLYSTNVIDEMKKLFLVSLFIFSLGCNLNNPITEFDIEEIPEEVEEVTEWDVFVEALIQVESEGNPFAVGKTNDLGILQITPIYVKDVNRILGEERFTLDCRIDIDKSLEMFEIYQSYYNPNKDINRAIKLHNPGAGSDYREKILSKINELKTLS
jgi:hypothetical protein